jgi:hypothetical protein
MFFQVGPLFANKGWSKHKSFSQIIYQPEKMCMGKTA